MKKYICIGIFLFVVVFLETFQVNASSNSVQIYQTIFENYNKFFRPVTDEKQAINVTVRFIPRGIVEFDEVGGKISVAMAIDIRWVDAFLKWNPRKYGNTYTLLVPDTEIWTPFLALANPTDRCLLFADDMFKARIYYNGSVVFIKAGTIRAACKPDVLNYPFDVHRCSVKVFPMDEIVREIMLHGDLRMDVFENFGQWDMYDERVYGDMLDIFSLAVFEFKIKRRPQFSLLGLCIPVLFIGILNSCVFLIPQSSGERISYAITLLLSLVVFMTIVNSAMPKNSDPVPMLSWILMTMIVESGFVVFFTVFGLRLHQSAPSAFRLKFIKLDPHKYDKFCFCASLIVFLITIAVYFVSLQVHKISI